MALWRITAKYSNNARRNVGGETTSGQGSGRDIGLCERRMATWGGFEGGFARLKERFAALKAFFLETIQIFFLVSATVWRRPCLILHA